MTQHAWSESDTRISNLGFFVGYDPSNIPTDEMAESVILEIMAKTKKPRKKIPKFRCNYSSPVLYDDDTKYTTKAFDLQCRQQDAKTLLDLLATTYVEDPKFIFHKLRHTNKEHYVSSLVKQNLYLKKSRIVPIAGIHPEVMWSLKDKISTQFEGVIRVTGHKDTDRIGRHNVHTTKAYFEELKSALKLNLVGMTQVEKHSRGLSVPDYDAPPRLAFRHENYGERGTGEYDEESTDHGGSYATYVSALNSLYTAKEDDDQDLDSLTNPPPSNGPVAQAWTSVVPVQTVVASTTTETSASQVSSEEYEKMKTENEELKSELNELKEAFKSFATKQKDSSETDKNQLVQTIMQTMQQQFATMMQQSMMPPTNYQPYAYQQLPPFAMSPVNPQHMQQVPHNLFPQHTPSSPDLQMPNHAPLPQTPQQHNYPPTQQVYEGHDHQSQAATKKRPNADSQQQATWNVDVSMVQANSPLRADENLANKTMQS